MCCIDLLPSLASVCRLYGSPPVPTHSTWARLISLSYLTAARLRPPAPGFSPPSRPPVCAAGSSYARDISRPRPFCVPQGRPMHVLYAWHDRTWEEDEAPHSIDRLQYHGRQNRGVLTLCLLHDDCFPPPPAGVGSNPDTGGVLLTLVAAVGVILMGFG